MSLSKSRFHCNLTVSILFFSLITCTIAVPLLHDFLCASEFSECTENSSAFGTGQAVSESDLEITKLLGVPTNPSVIKNQVGSHNRHFSNSFVPGLLFKKLRSLKLHSFVVFERTKKACFSENKYLHIITFLQTLM